MNCIERSLKKEIFLLKNMAYEIAEWMILREPTLKFRRDSWSARVSRFLDISDAWVTRASYGLIFSEFDSQRSRYSRTDYNKPRAGHVFLRLLCAARVRAATMPGVQDARHFKNSSSKLIDEKRKQEIIPTQEEKVTALEPPRTTPDNNKSLPFGSWFGGWPNRCPTP